MSLYVGHLSPHVRREELEQVFRRFGRCSVQLKDGYGFAVYEVAANAERALRALRGKKICGEQMSLNWSNKQPWPLQRPVRSTRFYEPHRGRNFREGNGRGGIGGSQDRRDFSTGAARVTMYNDGGHQLDNAPDKEVGHMHEDINDFRGDKGVNLKERVMDEGAANDLNPIENDRWGESGNDTLMGNGIENDDEFDRYEPYHGYNRSNENENNQMASSYGSPNRGNSQEKRHREHCVDDDSERNLDKSKPQLTCYNCGLVGHIMRNCPQGDARREKFGKFNHGRDEINFRDKGEGRLKWFRPTSWGRPDAGRDPLISRRHMRVRKEPNSEKARRASRTSETSPEIREKGRSKIRGDSREKKRSKLERGSPSKAARRRRRRRRYHTSSVSSDSSTTSSQSHSQSPRSISNSGSRSSSRTASSRSRSASSGSRSASLSSSSKSARSRSRSRSSFPRSLSLSVSLERKTTPSPKNKQMDVCMNTSLKGNVETVTSPESKHLENAKPNVTCSTVDDENAVTPFKMDGKTNGERIGYDGDDVRYTTFRVDCSESNTCADLHKDIVVTYDNHGQNNDMQEAPSAKLNRHIPSKSETSKSTRGHLSPHVRREELEQVFRRFGRCSVQLKDGYGFAVYEVAANAERALRALRGKKICGEQMSLNWSNKQPWPLQRPVRSTRFYEPHRGRNFREGNGRGGIGGSQDRRDFSTGAARVTMYNDGGHQLDNAPDKEVGHMHEDINDFRGDKGVNLKERVMDEGAANDLNPIENDRWGESGNDTLMGNGIENDDEFDRYEPYHGYNRSNENENNQMASSYGSPNRGNSQEKRHREHCVDDDSERNLDKSKPQLTCYNCGLVGHIMRNCPQGDARREKFGKFNHGRDEINFRDKGEGRLKWFRPTSWGRPDAGRDPLISRRHMRVRKEPNSEKARRASRTSETSPEIREKGRSKIRGDSREKKRSKLERGSPSKAARRRRRRRRYHTSSVSSDSSTTSSQSHSQSPRSISNSGSRSSSRTASSRSRSASSGSRSASLSSSSKSARSRSRSRSSFPRSLSLSVSLERKTTPSPKNKQMDVCMNTSLKGNVETVTSPESKHLENAKPNVTCSTVDDENAVTPFKMDGKTNGERIGYDGDDVRYTTFRVDCSESNTCADLHKDIVVTYDNHGQNNDMQEAPSAKLNRHIPSKSETSKSTRITTREMFLVLQHYGLVAPEEGLPDISVEEYFGAARLWPWEMIYYRRLKKGPISTENYARRLEQNKEFSIVDKYIRSSSGWGECGQNDT
ncbi:putative serine/arginine-rich splicing factor 4 [Cocos nucifera]|nr:putative serine/arginine-rich splicing factor 4 [Cocos nucifera]